MPPRSSGRADDAAAVVRARLDPPGTALPRFGVVLGSGLAGAVEAVRATSRIRFADIPGLPECTAPGHPGELLIGEIPANGGAPPLPVAVLNGRSHLYEGRSPDEVALGVRLFARGGVDRLLITAAVGGIRAGLAPGDFVRIEDHLNLTGRSPLVGPNPGPGPRFPDMTEAWDPALGAALDRASARASVPISAGAYAGVLGPQLETPAEIRMLRALGADLVGMSVVVEAIAARHAGMRIAGLALVTNFAAGLGPGPIAADHVRAAAERGAPRLARILRELAAEPDFVGQLPPDDPSSPAGGVSAPT